MSPLREKQCWPIFLKKERDDLIARLSLIRFNERTITSQKALKTELQTVRECGFALDRAEQLHGIVCVGAPVFNTAPLPGRRDLDHRAGGPRFGRIITPIPGP